MSAILKFFWQVCLLRETPANLPGDRATLGLIVGGYVVIAAPVILLTRPGQSLLGAVGILGCGLVLQGALVWGLLAYKTLANRFRATWGTLLGANAILLVILTPVNIALVRGLEGFPRMLADLGSWFGLFWWLAICGMVLHRAANITVVQGAVIAFVIELLSVIVAVQFFPATQAA